MNVAAAGFKQLPFLLKCDQGSRFPNYNARYKGSKRQRLQVCSSFKSNFSLKMTRILNLGFATPQAALLIANGYAVLDTIN